MFTELSVFTSDSSSVDFAVVPLFVIFASVSSFSPVGLLQLAFRTPYFLIGWSEFSLSSVGVLSLILGTPFLSFVFLPSLPFFGSFHFRSPAFFLTIRCLFCLTVSRYIRLSFSYPLSPLFLLLWGFADLLTVHLLRSSFSLGFLSFTSFRLRFFHLRVPMVFPCWYVHLLSVASPSIYGYFSFLSFICFSLASTVLSLALFLLPPWVDLLPASLSFSYFLCYARCFLVLLLFVRPLCLSSTVVS